MYALEGSIAVAGSLVQWLRDNLGLIGRASDVDELARTVPDSGGAVIVPAFSGLFAPHWRSDARGVIAGLTGFVTRAHLARAALEATAWQVREVVDAMAADSGLTLTELRVDGGMTASELLLQIQADVLDVPVVRPQVTRDDLPRRGVRGRPGGRLLARPGRAAGQLGAPTGTWQPAMAAGRPGRRLRPLAQGRRPYPRLGLTGDTDDGRRGVTRAAHQPIPERRLCVVTVRTSPTVTLTVWAGAVALRRSGSACVPTVLAWMAPTRSSLPEIGRSPTLVTTSPACRPAFAAGPPGLDALDLRATVLAVADARLPRYGWLTLPPLMSCLRRRSLALLAGMAKPTPMLPLRARRWRSRC